MRKAVWLPWPMVLILPFVTVWAGCTAYVPSPPPAPIYGVAPSEPPSAEPIVAPPPPEVYAPIPAVKTVEIRENSDFYEPLQAYGRWTDLPGYGRCWTPAGVAADWRPYTEGHWQRTDAGWYWVSDERWGWATCHYGRWHHDEDLGWVWAPQTQWAPAWVAWRKGGGYTGWAPLPPEAPAGEHGSLQQAAEKTDPHSYVFVEDRHILEPQRPRTVIVNNTTIINQTVNITKIVAVNNIVINEGPTTASVAQATGHPVDVTPTRTLRAHQEAPAIAEIQRHSPVSPSKVASDRSEPPERLPAAARAQSELLQTGGDKVSRAQPSPADVTEERPMVRPSTVSSAAKFPSPATTPPAEEREKPPLQAAHETAKPKVAALTTKQAVELEKKKAEVKQRLEKQKARLGSSTNAPAPPH